MILLDTHVWWWTLTEPQNLSENAISVIQGSKIEERFIAAISIWEFAMMVAKKRIELKISPTQWMSRAINNTGIQVIHLSPEIATDACNLPGEFHSDPADRMIVATARNFNLTLLTKDRKILSYSHVNAIW